MDIQPIYEDIYNLGVLVAKKPTQQEAYSWHVRYTDGTSTSEYDDARPDGRGWAERQEKPVQAIVLMPTKNTKEEQNITVPDGATPIFFRRRSIELQILSGASQVRPTVHCIGWKRDDEATYLFVLADGSTLLTNDLQAV